MVANNTESFLKKKKSNNIAEKDKKSNNIAKKDIKIFLKMKNKKKRLIEYRKKYYKI